MNTKATSIVLLIFEIAVVVTVIAMAITFAQKAGESETVIKTRIANDMSLMVNTLLFVPGDAVVQYPFHPKNKEYILILQQDHVSVGLRNELVEKKATKTFFLPQPYRAEGSIEGKEYWCVEKKSKTIILRECAADERVTTP